MVDPGSAWLSRTDRKYQLHLEATMLRLLSGGRPRVRLQSRAVIKVNQSKAIHKISFLNLIIKCVLPDFLVLLFILNVLFAFHMNPSVLKYIWLLGPSSLEPRLYFSWKHRPGHSLFPNKSLIRSGRRRQGRTGKIEGEESEVCDISAPLRQRCHTGESQS